MEPRLNEMLRSLIIAARQYLCDRTEKNLKTLECILDLSEQELLKDWSGSTERELIKEGE